jgi:hypothetical protein
MYTRDDYVILRTQLLKKTIRVVNFLLITKDRKYNRDYWNLHF